MCRLGIWQSCIFDLIICAPPLFTNHLKRSHVLRVQSIKLSMCFLTTQDAVHECPQCRNLIHRHSRISCPLTSPEGVMTLRFGSCAIVLSRRYCICFAALLTLIIMGHLLRMGLLANTLKELAKGTSVLPITRPPPSACLLPHERLSTSGNKVCEMLEFCTRDFR